LGLGQRYLQFQIFEVVLEQFSGTLSPLMLFKANSLVAEFKHPFRRQQEVTVGRDLPRLAQAAIPPYTL